MPPTDPHSLWMIAIGKQERNRIQVAIGKSIRRHPKWPPTIPEFVSLCDVDAEELGLPSLDEAFLEAQKKAGMPSAGKWSHPAIREAVKRVGSYDIARASSQSEQKTVKARFATEYNSLAKAMANGQTLLENDAQHNQGRAMADKMIRDGNKQAKDQGFEGIKGQDAIDRMKAMLKG